MTQELSNSVPEEYVCLLEVYQRLLTKISSVLWFLDLLGSLPVSIVIHSSIVERGSGVSATWDPPPLKRRVLEIMEFFVTFGLLATKAWSALLPSPVSSEYFYPLARTGS